MNRRSLLSLLGISGIGLLAASHSGCARTPILQVMVAFDVTPPDVDWRARQASQLVTYVTRDDRFTLFATDHETTVISTMRPHTDGDAYKLLKEASAKITPTTDLALCFKLLADTAEPAGPPLIGVIYTDGLDDSSDPQKAAERINQEAERLNRLPRLQALIVTGAIRDVRPGWKSIAEMLKPVHAKLTILPHATLNPSDIARIVKAARSNTTKRAQ